MFFKKKKPDSLSIQLIQKLNKMPVRSVVKRDRETFLETILGREGAINVQGKEFSLVCQGVDVFRGNIKDISIAELISKNGIVVKGFDKVSSKEIEVTAYYTPGFVSGL